MIVTPELRRPFFFFSVYDESCISRRKGREGEGKGAKGDFYGDFRNQTTLLPLALALLFPPSLLLGKKVGE